MKGEHTDEMQFKNGTVGMYKPRRQVRGEGGLLKCLHYLIMAIN